MYFYFADEFLIDTTTVQLPTTTQPPTPETPRPLNNTPSSEFDITGKKRFTGNASVYI